jgi:hypothetical protein
VWISEIFKFLSNSFFFFHIRCTGWGFHQSITSLLSPQM